jgi:WD40 repeat protein
VRAGVIASTSGNVEDLSMSPKGAVLAAGTDQGTAQLWNIADPYRPAVVTTLPGQTGYTQVRFDRDGTALATAGSDGSVVVWNVSTRGAPVEVTSVTGHGDGISAMGFGANDSTLITVGLDNSLIGLDNTVQMVDLPVLAMNRAANENVESAAFGPAGRSLVTTEFTEVEDRAEGTTTLWDLAGTPRRTGVLSSPAPGGSETVGTEAVFGPDHLLATSGWQAAQMWNVADPAHPAPLGTLSARNSASPMAFSQVGHVFVDGAGDLWDVRDPSHPQQVGHVDPTDSSSVQGQDGGMAFRPDGHGRRGGRVHTGRPHPRHRGDQRHGPAVGRVGRRPPGAARHDPRPREP